MRSDIRALLAILALLLAAPLANAQPVRENDLKAAFIFNFAVFTEWPQDALASGSPISVCASASNPTSALSSVAFTTG